MGYVLMERLFTEQVPVERKDQCVVQDPTVHAAKVKGVVPCMEHVGEFLEEQFGCGLSSLVRGHGRVLDDT